MNLHTEAESEQANVLTPESIDSTQSSVCRAVVSVMRDQQYGRIVNVSASIAHGWTGPVGTAGRAGIRGGKIRHSGTDRATCEGCWRI